MTIRPEILEFAEAMERVMSQHWDFCINKLGLGRVLRFIKVKYGG